MRCEDARVAGTDTVRGIAYQQAQAVLEALTLLDGSSAVAMRVEGVHDVVDVEVLDHLQQVLAAKQFKIRAEEYTWGQAELVSVLLRWAALPAADSATFEFVTDGRLGPTGQHVSDALAACATGDARGLAALLGQSSSSQICRCLSGGAIRIDPVGVGALLLRAERQVMAMLPGPRTPDDAKEAAEHAVDRLFRLLMERAGHPDPKHRVIDRREVAEVLGVGADQAADQRWPGTLRERYLTMAGALDLNTVTTPLLEQHDDNTRSVRLVDASGAQLPSVLVILDLAPALIFGRTGEGKSTACRVLVRDAALDSRVVLLAHAESYLPRRLAALAADALSEIIDAPMPVSTGAQVLADSDVTLVIDGVSEVAPALRQALAEDLQSQVSSGRGARIILVGRDIAALRAVFPTSRTPTAITVAALDSRSREDLTHRLLVGGPAPENAEQYPHSLRTLIAQAERALGDAAGNPLIFAMAVGLLAEGVPFTNRAAMYSAFVERLASRTGAEGIAEATRVLRVAYARLLDEERRYADPYEWRSLLATAAELMAPPGDAARADAAARRSGITTSVGYAQTVVPMHDSFADYLAGAAHAARLVAFPASLKSADEQRVAISAELNGVDAAMAAQVVRDLPFLAVSLRERDQRSPDDSWPAEVSDLLGRLLPATEPHGVTCWRAGNRTVAFRTGDESSWVDEEIGRGLLHSVPSIAAQGGPLDLTVALWQQYLLSTLTPAHVLPPPRPRSIEEACAALRAHADAVVVELERLIGIVPASALSAVVARIGPLGMTARVSSSEDGRGRYEWSMVYRHTDGVDIAAADPADPDYQGSRSMGWGSSSVDFTLSSSPAEEAAKRLMKSINGLVGSHWP